VAWRGRFARRKPFVRRPTGPCFPSILISRCDAPQTGVSGSCPAVWSTPARVFGHGNSHLFVLGRPDRLARHVAPRRRGCLGRGSSNLEIQGLRTEKSCVPPCLWSDFISPPKTKPLVEVKRGRTARLACFQFSSDFPPQCFPPSSGGPSPFLTMLLPSSSSQPSARPLRVGGEGVGGRRGY